MKAGGLKPRAELELDRLALDPYCRLYLPLWKLDGDSFADRSAYGHLCTNYGSLWTPHGRYFDGVDDYVDCGNKPSLRPQSKITVELWLMSLDVSIKRPFLSSWVTTQEALLIFRHNEDGRLYYALNQSDHTWVDGTVTTILSNNQSYLTNLVADGSQIKVYVNSAIDPTVRNYNGTLNSDGTDPLLIGCQGNQWWKGPIGEVLIYSRALTPQEILYHYIVGKELFG